MRGEVNWKIEEDQQNVLGNSKNTRCSQKRKMYLLILCKSLMIVSIIILTVAGENGILMKLVNFFIKTPHICCMYEGV